MLSGAYLFPLFYFLPALVGLRKRDRVASFSLNLLLGWTVLGWIVALVWPLKRDPAHV